MRSSWPATPTDRGSAISARRTATASTVSAGFYGAFAGSDARASHLELFSMPNVPDVRAHLLAQDVIWVGGGSVANLLAVWRVHGLDDVMREAGRPASCSPGCRRARSAGTSAAPPTRSASSSAR